MQAGPFRLGRNYDRKRINYWLEVIYCHADPVCRDEMIGLDEGATGTPVVAKFNDPYMKMLAETTSKFPEAIAAQNLGEIGKRQSLGSPDTRKSLPTTQPC